MPQGMRKVLQDFEQELCGGEQARSYSKWGLSDCYRTLPACSSTSIFFSNRGGRAMYCARASRALEEVAGILTERSTLKPLCVQPSMFLARRSLRRERFWEQEGHR